jgi:hypothetical protein
MNANCVLFGEIICEIQLIVAENGAICRTEQRRIILEMADKMIKDGLIDSESTDIDEIILNNIDKYLGTLLKLKNEYSFIRTINAIKSHASECNNSLFGLSNT